MIATPSRTRRTSRLALAATAASTAALFAAMTVAAGPASAATHGPAGRIGYAWQSTITHQVHVSGFAYDSGSGQRHRPVRVALYVNGKYARSVEAARTSVGYDKHRHIHGKHAFSAVFDHAPGAHEIRLVVHSAGRRNGSSVADTAAVHRRTPESEAIVQVARRYVGSRYSYGADGPHAFDCSGYSKFVYRKADVATLPHNAQAQRDAKHMHAITRSHARPGDLVFYLDGNDAYHVSIYAGHDMQYSATDPRRGVEHSRISSRHVVFKTDWH